MSENNNIRNFTAADIEKYHKGLLSMIERHAMEKAALDDPFLADALEGYAAAGVNVADDIAELKERLSKKMERGKVIPMGRNSQSKFLWWRVAAIIILVAGAGFLVYQFGFNKKTTGIAQNEVKKNEEPKDSNQFTTITPQKTEESTPQTETANNNGKEEKPKQDNLVVKREVVGSGMVKTDSLVNNFALSNNNPSTSAPARPVNNDKSEVAANNKETKPVTVLSDVNLKTSDDKKAEEKIAAANKLPEAEGGKDFSKATQGIIAIRKADNQFRGNIFRGRVMDANNNSVPFANITNISDSVGTYADAKGYFNFVSTDTMMNVEVRSVGFNSINTQLRNNIPANEVVLQEDRSLTARILDTTKSIARKLSIEPNVNVEDAEPEDGWGLYDTYIVNNLQVPNAIKAKQTRGEVKVSFEVDKNGELTNIKIVKSLCDECDKEAVRLIKEGPKWKHKAKKGRATVTISF